jgi:hypothetical protein
MMDTTDMRKMPYALWTRGAVAELIVQRFGIRLPVRTMGLYLARWGFTPHKPIRRAYEQSPAAVRQWLDEEYPAIAARAKAEGGEIHWGDETGLRSDDVRGRSFAPRGATPVVRISHRREGLSVISTVTNRGQLRWKIFEGALNADLLIDLLRRLTRSAGKKTVMLAFFIPGIVYLADAVGTQTETIVVRGLSVGVTMRRMIRRELLSGLVIGFTLAAIAGPLVWWWWGDASVALAVGLALFAACSTATLAAMLLPWVFSAAGRDPAFGSGPLATVIQDLLSILIYFAIAAAVVR